MGFLRQRVRHDHQAICPAARRGFVVVLRNQFRDGLGEFGGERRPVSRRPEANLGILLFELAAPASAATLATRVGLARQKIHYRLHALEAHGLMRLTQERKWAG